MRERSPLVVPFSPERDTLGRFSDVCGVADTYHFTLTPILSLKGEGELTGTPIFFLEREGELTGTPIFFLEREGELTRERGN